MKNLVTAKEKEVELSDGKKKKGRRLVDLSPSTQEHGYESSNPFVNSAFAIMLICVILGILLLVAILALLCKNKYVQKLYVMVKKKMFWSTFIRYLLENFLMLCVTNIIKCYALDWSSFKESATSFYALVLVSLLAACPFLARYFLYKSFDKGNINDEEFRVKYGEIIKHVHGNDKGCLLFNIFFMIRRILMAITIVMLPHMNWLQR